MAKRWMAGAAVLLAMAGGACTETTADDARGAVVVFAFDGHPQDTLRVEVTDPETILQAEAYVRTGKGAHIPIGPIARGAGADPRYPFHFVADSVRLAEMTMELCDGAPMRTEAQVNELFELTGRAGKETAPYCPWSARPIAVRAAE